ncbi:MAG: hypothetical protein GY841_04665 [FCB group bacterium]|nr:hypothetical protein [FCB group bacterium]
MIGLLAGCAASGSLVSTLGCAAGKKLSPASAPGRVLADLHVHSLINEWNRTTPMGVRYPGLLKLVEKFANKTGMNWENCHGAGVDLICVAHFNVFDEWLSMPTDPNPEAPAHTLQMMNQLEEILNDEAEPYARLARNSFELDDMLNIPKADPRFRTAVVHTVEGGHALGGSLEPVAILAERGVAIITVTHFFNKGIASAANAFPFFPDAGARPANQGLSEFGRKVIREMEKHGIIVDLIHAEPTAVGEILAYAKEPVIATHSSARTLGDHPYSLYDEHIKQISNDGGIIGVIIDPYLLSNYADLHQAEKEATLADVVRTVRYMVKLCGTHKSIAIGSDFGGFITGPTDMLRLEQVSHLRKLLIREFGSVELVEDILANNAINFLKDHWGRGGER